MEEFDVATTDPRAGERTRIEGQTLRLYDPAPQSAHVEQSLSPDWGTTWEVNWILDLTPQDR